MTSTQLPRPVKRTPRIGRTQMTGGKVVLALEILCAYVQVRWLLWRKQERLPPIVAALRGTQVRRSAGAVEPHLASHRLGRAVMRTLSVLPTDSRCLMRSLVLTSLLARRGIPARLVIGVKGEGDFAAHAWVEYEGKPVLPTDRDEYGRLLEV